ncbi:MAG: restriction endonuclease subunit S [Christensenellaceae bacterium]|nr:restriction endonuclease subunit S [Christensenellaceae bacterium]
MLKTFDDVLTIRNGKNQKAVENPDGRYPIYGSGGVMGWADDYICGENTVVIGRKGSINNPIFVEEPFWNVDTAFGLVADEKQLLPRYLYYFCRYFDFEKLNTTVTIPSLTKANLLKIQIEVPDKNQQAEIIERLQSVEKLVALRKEQLTKLDNLVKARFVEMFGDPANNPMGWKTLTFKEACIKISDGPFGSNLKSEHYSESGIRVIRLGNIGVGTFIDNDRSFIPEEHYQKLKKYTCKSGEIVIGTLGEPNLRACILPDWIGVAVNKADCVHYIPKPDILMNRFVCQYINCPETLLLASGLVHGQTRSRVSSGQIAAMPIFVPPMELQQKFSAFVAQIDKSKVVVQKALNETQMLFDSLMQEYFG